jgi:chorismate mutase|tara:strand:+ start:242 stop:535 length:294 start_codon:yes stop_codon:yes gene_type:complete
MSYEKEIEELRDLIDITDEIIMDVIISRINLTKDFGRLKKKYDTHEMCPKRREDIFEKIKQQSIENDVDPEITRAVFDFLMNYSVEVQNRIINGLAK